MLLQVRLKIAALTPRESYVWKLNFLKLFLSILLELSQRLGRGPHVQEVSLASLEKFIPFYIRIKFLLFSSLAQHLWVIKRIHPHEPQHCIFGVRDCVQHIRILLAEMLCMRTCLVDVQEIQKMC